MGPLLLARAALRPLLVGRGVVQLHDLVGHVDRLVIVEERAAGGLEHERVAVLLAVVAHQLVELRDDALGELGVGLLEIALEVLVLALELEAAALEVLLQVAPLLVLQHRRLALVVLLQPVQVLTLLLQLVLRALELRLHLVLRPFAGVAFVERALHVDHPDLLLHRPERRRPEHERQRHQPERHAGAAAALASPVPISHVPPSPSSRQYWNGAPNENSTRLLSCGLVWNGFPSSMRSGPMGESQRTPAPAEKRVSSSVKPWSALWALPASTKSTPFRPMPCTIGKMTSLLTIPSSLPPIGLVEMARPKMPLRASRGPRVRVLKPRIELMPPGK